MTAVLFGLLPLVVSPSGLEKFRVPKDAISVGLIALIGAAFLLQRRWLVFRRPSYWTLLLLTGLGYSFVHTLIWGRPGMSWPGLFYLLFFAGLLLVLSRIATVPFQRKIWLILGVSLSINAAVTVLQYYGLFPLMVRSGGQDLAGRLTPAGFVGNVNTGGLLFGLAVLMMLYWLANEENRQLKLLAGGLLAINLVGLIYTRTLTALLALSICLVVWVLFHQWWLLRNQFASRGKILLLWGLLLLLMTGGGLAAWQSGLTDRASTVFRQFSSGDLSQATSGRYPVYLITWQMVQEHPLWGRGLNSFGQDFFFQRADTSYGQQQPMLDQPGAFRQVHNEFLQIWAELGLVGLVLFLGLVLLTLYQALRRLPRLTAPDQYWLALQCIGVIYLLIASLSFFPLHLSATAAVGVLLLASLHHQAKPPKGLEGETLGQWLGRYRVPRWVTAALVVALAGVSVWWQTRIWQANVQLGVASRLLEQAQSFQDKRLQRRIAEEAARRLDRNLHPFLPDYSNLRGSAAMLLGRPEEAREFYLEATRRQPSPETLTHLAAAHLTDRQYQEARELLERALRYNPNYTPAQEALEYLEKLGK